MSATRSQDDIEVQSLIEKTIRASESVYTEGYKVLEQEHKRLKKKANLLRKASFNFYRQVEYDLARYSHELLIEQYPDDYRSMNNLGLCLVRLGRAKEAVSWYQKALTLSPSYHIARLNLAYALHYYGESGREDIFDAHRDIAKFAYPESKSYCEVVELPLLKKKFRIGYVSGDFREHAVGRFVEGIITHHNYDRFEVHLFNNRKDNHSETAARLRESQAEWHDIYQLNEAEACHLINSLKIDILIDLSGHTSGGRPDILHNRVAPVQINYLGYPNTSGLPTIDFRLVDEYTDRGKISEQMTEQPLLMSCPMWNYTPWPDMPESLAIKSPLENRPIIFGSANNHAKIQSGWVENWAKILFKVPNSILRIKSRSVKNPVLRQQIIDIFIAHKVDPARLEFQHYSPTRKDHWAYLANFDIALDTYPYNGTTTTCDLLYLGVPVVTKAGDSHVSRTTGSILLGLGLSSLVAKTDDAYVECAVSLANDRYKLAKYQQTMRSQMTNCSVGSIALFISSYERKLVEAWHTKASQSRSLL